MNKKQLHHLWTVIRPLKVWYFVVLSLASGGIAIAALRDNNVRMVELRDYVYQADQKGEGLEEALQQLRRHVYGHMNTSLASGSNTVYPPIQLKYTYERLREAENKRVQKNNTQMYTDAQNFCEQQNATDFSGRNRIPCIEQYVNERSIKAKNIPDALYKFDFISPTWSPDVAGFALVFFFLGLLALGFRIVAGLLLPKLAK